MSAPSSSISALLGTHGQLGMLMLGGKCFYLPLVTLSSLVVIDHQLLLLRPHDCGFWLQMRHSLFEVHKGSSEGVFVRDSMV